MKKKPPIVTDMTGRICLVTGANAGIGREICLKLAKLHATVVMACRNEMHGKETQEEIIEISGNNNVFLHIVDLSNQQSIRDFVKIFLREYNQFHVLVNNAGISLRKRRESVDGIECTFATNVLAYFLLSNLLIEKLKASVPSRIVHVASEFAGRLNMADLEGKKKYNGQSAYMQSKQANRMLSHYQAELLHDCGITVNCVSPGLTNSGLFRDQSRFFRWIVRRVGKSMVDAADTIIWLAAADEVQGETGKFWMNRTAKERKFYNPQQMKLLWDRCREMTNC